MNIKQCCLLLPFISLQLLAQAPVFEHFATAQGLSQNTVTCLLQDQQGFLWLGTRNGLNRFDGYRFTTYSNEQEDPHSLSNNHINDLLEDRQGYIWVATQDGLNRFDLATEQFLTFRHELNDSSNLSYEAVHSIHEDEHGDLWVGNGHILEKLNREDNTFTHYPVPYDIEYTVGNLFIKHITHYQGQLYLGTWGEGVMRFDRQTGKYVRLFTNVESFNTDNWIDEFSIDQSGELWAAINGYGFVFDRAQDLFLKRFGVENMDFSSTTTAFLRTSTGQLYAGTSGIGVQLIEPDFQIVGPYMPTPSSANQFDNFVNCMLEDQAQEVWLGTASNGLFKFDLKRKQFHSFSQNNDQEIPNNIFDILETTQGETWLASRSSGLYKFEKENGAITPIKPKSGLRPKSATCLFQDSMDRIWMGTWGEGLLMFDPATGSSRQFLAEPAEVESLADLFVSSICEANDRKLWITFPAGVSVLDLDEVAAGVFKNYLPDEQGHGKLSNHVAYTAFCDHAGQVWIGTADGLNRYLPDVDSFQHFVHAPYDPSTLSGKRVNCIFEDLENNLWVGTTGGGLSRFSPDRQEFVHFSEKDGLASNAVQGIVQDDQGILWLTTGHGLTRFDIGTGNFSNYYASDGLPGDRFNSRAITLNQQTGQIFAGSADGFVVFHPDSIRNSTFVPPVVISSLVKFVQEGEQQNAVEVKGVSTLQRIELPFAENTLRFEFAALNFRQAAQNQYAYRLEGLNDAWTYLGNHREATFNQLPPGRYTLEFKASNNDGLWNEQGEKFDILIRPPWYRTWLAYAAYLLAVVGGVYFFQKRKMQERWLRRRLELEKLTAEKLKEVDLLKSRLYTNITHEFRTPLTIISGLAESIQSPRNSREIIQRNARGLLHLVNQMLDLAKLESGNLSLDLLQADVVPFVQYLTDSLHSYAASKNVRLVFQKRTDKLVMDFDEKKLRSVISNLLSNAIKFTEPGGEVKVSLEEVKVDTGGQLVLKVKDTGIGIPQDKLPYIFDRFYQVDDSTTRKGEGTGIGLTLTKELVELMQGQLKATSQLGSGTTFTLRLPVTNQAVLAKPEIVKPHVSPQAQQHPSSPNGTEDLDQPLLLIIEDNADMVTYIQSVLQSEYKILVAENGAAGIQRAFETIPDIILSDLMMPEMDGYAVTQAIKKDERTSHIPIILLTAKADVESRIKGLERGADAYLAKPFHKKELLVRLGKLVEMRAKLQAKYANQERIEKAPAETANLEDAFLAKVERAMDMQLEESNFTVAQLSQAVGLSQPQLYRKLKALTGKSIVAWMRDYRLYQAKKMLEDSNLQVSEIAFQVGFSDPAYFSRVFSEKFGESPATFRK